MSYWQKRALDNQAKAERLAHNYAQRSRNYYQKAHAAIEARIDSLIAAMDAGYVPTRTELWNMVKWTNLKEEIEKQTGIIGRLQIEDIDEVANRVYEETVGLTLREFQSNRYNLYNAQQTQQVLNAAFEDVKYSEKIWAGSSVGSRIHSNCQVLNLRLMKDMEDMVCLGKSPTKIKEALAADFKTAYSNADRLVRTEANHIYNTAAKEGYKAAGVERVEMLVEDDACDECAALAGEYDIDRVPILPVHPNCRCCYIPVVTLDKD